MAVLAHQRMCEPTLIEVHEGEAALIAVPLLVDIGVVPCEPTRHDSATYIRAQGAARCAVLAGRRGAHQVKGTGSESIERAGQGTHGADLDRVAGEVGIEGLISSNPDLLLCPTLQEFKHRVAGDLLGEAGAPGAGDAALPIEEDLRTHIDRLGEGALCLLKARGASPRRHRLVLQGALTTLVTDRAVEGMVEEEELHHALLGMIGHLRCALGAHHHAFGNRDGACRLRLDLAFDLNETHAAGGHRIQQGMVAKARNLDAHEFRDSNHERAFGDPHLNVVKGECHQVRRRHRGGGLGCHGHRVATSPKM